MVVTLLTTNCGVAGLNLVYKLVESKCVDGKAWVLLPKVLQE